jgi:hypothetical protein
MTKAIETAIKLLETLPEPTQEHLVEELRRLAVEAQDEAKWDQQFAQRSAGLKAAARKAREEITKGKASDMDFDKL